MRTRPARLLGGIPFVLVRGVKTSRGSVGTVLRTDACPYGELFDVGKPDSLKGGGVKFSALLLRAFSTTPVS